MPSMSAMPTPASSFSAYERRRHILEDTPNTVIIQKPVTETQRTIWRSPKPPSLPSTLYKKLSPIVTFTQTTVVKALAITLSLLLLTQLVTPLLNLPALILNRCNTVTPISTYPITSLFLRVLTIPLITLTLITHHLLSNTSRTIQAVGVTLTAILQTTLQNFLTFGSIPPHPYLKTACMPASTTTILPSWSHLLPQILHTSIAAPLYHLLTTHASPPPSTLRHRSFTRTVTLPAIPTLIASLPVLLVPLFTLFFSGYPQFVRSLGSVNSALLTTFTTLLSWNIQTSLHQTSLKVSSPEIERDRLDVLLRENASSNLVLPSLMAITTSNNALHHFPGFTDATGTAWRTILAHCLHPLATIRNKLQTRPSSTLFTSSTQVWPIVIPQDITKHALITCTALARVFEECVQADTFGVVHRTLPYTLAELLRCKVETAAFVTERSVEWGDTLRRFVDVRSSRDMIIAVDDALSVCVYRIVGAFKGHLGTYIRGGEVEWDRGLNGLLQAFLEYQVP